MYPLFIEELTEDRVSSLRRHAAHMRAARHSALAPQKAVRRLYSTDSVKSFRRSLRHVGALLRRRTIGPAIANSAPLGGVVHPAEEEVLAAGTECV